MVDAAIRRPSAERASAMVLLPAMTLVVIALGAIAVDLSLVHSAHRSTSRVAESAADDAAAMLDERELQRSGEIRIDGPAATRVVEAHVAAASLPGDLVELSTSVDVTRTTVEVTIVVDVDHVLLPTGRRPGGGERLTATARARLQR